MTNHLQDTGTIRAIRTVDRPRSSVGGIVLIALGVASLLIGATELLPPEAHTPGPAVAASSDTFLPNAVGVAIRDATLTARPQGAAAGFVEAGTALRIGGRVNVPSGLGTRTAYWVSPPSQMPLYGWLLDTDVLVTAGNPPLLTRLPTGTVGEGVNVAQAAPEPTATMPPAPTESAPLAYSYQADVPASARQWSSIIETAATRHGVPVRLLGCMMGQESDGRVGAVSPKGALGLLQIMPATGVEIATERGLLAEHSTARLQTDPAYNVDFGAYYASKQYQLYGSWTLALVAYNGGGGAVAKYRAGTPYKETRQYLAAILPCFGAG